MSRQEESVATLKTPVTSVDHIQGPESAAITLVEYGDYECPSCGRAYLIVKRLQKHFGRGLVPVASERSHTLTADSDALSDVRHSTMSPNRITSNFFQMYDFHEAAARDRCWHRTCLW
jgi:hypothetical protein